MTTPSFDDLHLLTVLAQTRSYTSTAARLGISKASVSMRVAALERAAGVQLVRRTTRSVTLTPAGQEFVGASAHAFEHIERAFGGVRDLADEPRGLVRVTAPVALGRQHIAPTLAAFCTRYPEVRLELDLSDRLVNLAQDGFDLAIRHAEAPPETHVAWALAPCTSILVASAGYLHRRGMPKHPNDLAGHACLLYLRGGGRTWTFQRGDEDPVSVVVDGPLKANNSEVLRQAALGGLGIALLPAFSAAGHMGTRRLVQVLPKWRPLGFFAEQIYAIRPWSPHVPRAVQCVVDHFKAVFAAQDWRSAAS
ncbi:LysR family transcriptional regulator [Ramlibacter algicola]|uniref:LysR family transcriptional regulator n=1 Tax=Ramlibacter algicola TaxID=2795217 RepID=A0A934UR79_9BURK|nr:LysR family transcriptional regulator [Ramlibacter algicola]MBK0392591.1 LysR family transcriptional regulator [Ramlibacter algicola]